MSAQHTPGQICDACEGVCLIPPKESPCITGAGFIPRSGGFAEVFVDGRRVPLKMLAAAPDLLTVSRLAVEKLESMGLGGTVECNRIRAAIAKATGSGA
jgi:hypothetical protein